MNSINVIMQCWSQRLQPQFTYLYMMPVRYWQLLVYAVLVLWLIIMALPVVKGLFLSKPDVIDTVNSIQIGPPSKDQIVQPVVALEILQSWHFFGEWQEPVVEVVDSKLTELEANAEDTQLQLTLNGVATTHDQTAAQAIIAYQNAQAAYHVGSKLPVGNNVSVSKILNDRVILLNEGKLEALYLYDETLALIQRQDRNNKDVSFTATGSMGKKASSSNQNSIISMRERMAKIREKKSAQRQ